MAKIIIISLFSFLLVSNNSFSQNKKDIGAKFLDKPIIELSYGVSEIALENLSSKISNTGTMEVKLGYSTQTNSHYGKSVLKYRNGFSFLSFSSSELDPEVGSNSDLSSETWRFGFGMKEGYGVEMGSSAIMPYTSGGFVWSRFDLRNNSGNLSSNDANLLANFNETFRFGTLSESGINVQIIPLITLQGKYETATVFPRHLVAKQMGSMLIETVGSALLGEFIDNVMHNSPVLGTIVNFTLRSAYSIGMYELRKSEMNWPFGGEAPLSFETYKVGMTFTF
jgi:hypothetical protein